MTTFDRRLHARALELAATRLDFALAPAETAELEGHLAICPICARAAAGLRADAVALGRPAELATSRRLDAAIGAAIAGPPARLSSAQLIVLVAATALLLIALLGLAAVGASFLRERLATVVVPSPTEPAVVVNPSPAPRPAPGVLQPGSLAVTVSDELVVRSKPQVSDDSVIYRPYLPTGTELLVIEGPVAASGYSWYHVDPIGFTLDDGVTDGWVAMAAHDGTPWVAAAETPPVTGWPTVGRAGIVMTGAVVETRDLDGSLHLSIEVRGLAPGIVVELAAAGTYGVDWFCPGVGPGASKPGAGYVQAGRTDGSATSTARLMAGSDGTTAALIRLLPAPPAQPCPTDHPGPPVALRGRWEALSVADSSNGLVLTPDPHSWDLSS